MYTHSKIHYETSLWRLIVLCNTGPLLGLLVTRRKKHTHSSTLVFDTENISDWHLRKAVTDRGVTPRSMSTLSSCQTVDHERRQKELGKVVATCVTMTSDCFWPVSRRDLSHWHDTAPQPVGEPLLSPDSVSRHDVSSSFLRASLPARAPFARTPRPRASRPCWVAGSTAEVREPAERGCWWSVLATDSSTWRTDTDDSASWTSRRRTRCTATVGAGQPSSTCRYTEIGTISRHQQDRALSIHTHHIPFVSVVHLSTDCLFQAEWKCGISLQTERILLPRSVTLAKTVTMTDDTKQSNYCSLCYAIRKTVIYVFIACE